MATGEDGRLYVNEDIGNSDSEDGCSETQGLLDDEATSISDAGEHLAEREDGVSNFGTIMHIIKGNIGTGILAMPVAFSHAGILTGTVLLAILAVICVHCMHILVKCSHYLCKKTNKDHIDYADVAEHSVRLLPAPHPKLPKAARTTVNVFLLITQFGFCCVYVLFIAQNIKVVVQKWIGNGPDSDNYRINFPMSIQLYEVILVALLIPFVFIKNIKHLAPFSMLANIASILGLGIILYYILIHEKFQSISRLPLFKSWSELPLYFGTAIYAFEGIGVVLPLENTMKEPKAFPSMFGVLNLGMTIVCVLYMTVGFYGYIEFGDEAKGSITLNLESWFGIVVQVIFALCIYVSYSLQFYVPLTIIGPTIASSRLAQRIGPNVLDYIVRAGLVIVTFGVAAIVDEYLDLLIALIGSIASAALALMFPAILEIFTFWPERRNRRFFWVMFTKDILIFIFGFLCFITGTIVAIQQLAEKLSSKTKT